MERGPQQVSTKSKRLAWAIAGAACVIALPAAFVIGAVRESERQQRIHEIGEAEAAEAAEAQARREARQAVASSSASARDDGPDKVELVMIQPTKAEQIALKNKRLAWAKSYESRYKNFRVRLNDDDANIAEIGPTSCAPIVLSGIPTADVWKEATSLGITKAKINCDTGQTCVVDLVGKSKPVCR